MMYNLLPFDTKLFGYNVARLGSNVTAAQLPETLSGLKKKRVKLVYWFLSLTDEEKNRVARTNGGICVDEKIEYVMKGRVYQKTAGMKPSPVYVYKGKRAGKRLVSLALQSGEYSRFKTDRHFVHNEYKKLYTTWIQKSVRRRKAFEVLVYAVGGREKGLITLESSGITGNIGLVAVDKSYRGKSVGKMLVWKAFEEFNKRGFKKITVSTQKKNSVACRFYESLGFRKVKTMNVYHFWL